MIKDRRMWDKAIKDFGLSKSYESGYCVPHIFQPVLLTSSWGSGEDMGMMCNKCGKVFLSES